MNTTVYRFMDGTPATLNELCREDPAWAANRIRSLTNALGGNSVRKIYVASSWYSDRQQEVYSDRQQEVVRALRKSGHEVYDFRHPDPSDNGGFRWLDMDPNWETWTSDEFIGHLNHPIARKSFELDFEAMQWADTFVLLTPCGRSAHLEAGWAMGAGKTVVILLNDTDPELMYRLAIVTGGCIRGSLREIIEWLSPAQKERTFA